MSVIASLLLGAAMVVVVFAAGVGLQIWLERRYQVKARPAPGSIASQAHQQGVRAQLGGFGPGSGPQN